MERPIIAISKEVGITKDKPTYKTLQQGIDNAAFGPKLQKDQRLTIEFLIKKFYNQFGLGKHELGKITKHQVSLSLNIEKPYPPILKKNYPASPRNRVEIDKHIDELLQLEVIRKVGNNEAVDIATPVIILAIGKSRL
ncbi:hypothetical protein CROQUDRAFT_53323, partial [Cronartium quercuum f. sp. fusiforme G11]